VNDLFSVSGRVVVVTGGVGQLGRQYCTFLLERGARVASFDNHPERSPASLPERFPEHYLPLHVDVTDKASLARGLDTILTKWEPPFGLVNNAAIDAPPDASADENGPFEAFPESSWDRVMEVNLKGVFLTTQVIGAEMARAGRGSIINISSIYGLVSPDQRIYHYRAQRGQPFFKPVTYSVSKSGLLNLTRYLATYWAGRNVRVNTLTLAGVFNHQDPDFLRAYTEKVPLARMAREDEYNGALVFLLSDASSYMTGSNLVVDGGWTAW